MRVLVTGARGQVGKALIASAPSASEIFAVAHTDLDIGDAAAVDSFVSANRPDVIVNAAAYTAVDKAESERELAERVNAAGPANLARIAAKEHVRLIHISTDFVFDGLASVPYRPNDTPAPLSVYGATKLAGEAAVRRELPGAVILRTSWVYDGQGRNFLMTMLRLMKERGTVKVVADQIGTPTAALSIAAALWGFIFRPALTGIHHWTDSGVASWYDFAVAISEERARVVGQSATVLPIATSDYPTPARRPHFSVLDKSATIDALGVTPPHWRENLRKVMGEISLA